MHKTAKSPDIQEILRRGDVVSHFQPIVSIKKKSVIGFEALSRGVAEQTGDLISPKRLFDAAEREGLTMELDRLCRTRAFEAYGGTRNDPDRFILTVNLDPSILNEETVGSNHLRSLAESLGIQPGRVLIEIIESRIRDIEALKKFVAL